MKVYGVSHSLQMRILRLTKVKKCSPARNTAHLEVYIWPLVISLQTLHYFVSQFLRWDQKQHHLLHFMALFSWISVPQVKSRNSSFKSIDGFIFAFVFLYSWVWVIYHSDSRYHGIGVRDEIIQILYLEIQVNSHYCELQVSHPILLEICGLSAKAWKGFCYTDISVVKVFVVMGFGLYNDITLRGLQFLAAYM